MTAIDLSADGRAAPARPKRPRRHSMAEVAEALAAILALQAAGRRVNVRAICAVTLRARTPTHEIVRLAEAQGHLIRRPTGEDWAAPWIWRVTDQGQAVMSLYRVRLAMPPRRLTPRACMVCGATFESAGAHDRVCCARQGRAA